MERIVKVNVDIKIARSMLGIAGFNEVATKGTDEDVFNQVLDVNYHAPKGTWLATPL